MKGLKAWITGQRKDQSPGTRQAVPVVQVDPVFEGQAGGASSLVKYNPLSNVTSSEVWNFLRVMVSVSAGFTVAADRIMISDLWCKLPPLDKMMIKRKIHTEDLQITFFAIEHGCYLVAGRAHE